MTRRFRPLVCVALLLLVWTVAVLAATFSDALSTNAANLGTNWQAGYTSDDPIQVTTNKAEATTVAITALETVKSTTYSPTADQSATVTLTTWNAASAVVQGIDIRLRNSAPPTDNGYACHVRMNSGAFAIRIERVTAGAVAGSPVTDNSFTPAAGDTYTCQAVGTHITAKRNGSAIAGLDLNDATYASGLVGLAIATNGTLTDIQLNTFSAADLSAAASTCGGLRLLGVGCH